jgi:hypothetical protein
MTSRQHALVRRSVILTRWRFGQRGALPPDPPLQTLVSVKPADSKIPTAVGAQDGREAYPSAVDREIGDGVRDAGNVRGVDDLMIIAQVADLEAAGGRRTGLRRLNQNGQGSRDHQCHGGAATKAR